MSTNKHYNNNKDDNEDNDDITDVNNSDNNNNNNSSKVVDDRDLHLVVVVDEARFKVSEKYPNKQENSFFRKITFGTVKHCQPSGGASARELTNQTGPILCLDV